LSSRWLSLTLIVPSSTRMASPWPAPPLPPRALLSCIVTPSRLESGVEVPGGFGGDGHAGAAGDQQPTQGDARCRAVADPAPRPAVGPVRRARPPDGGHSGPAGPRAAEGPSGRGLADLAGLAGDGAQVVEVGPHDCGILGDGALFERQVRAQ